LEKYRALSAIVIGSVLRDEDSLRSET
jgi:hypothetical protein